MALEVPPKGSIKAIRESLGMTARQLGARMGVAPSRVVKIQRDEVTGATTLKTLRRAAAAMNCRLCYVFVPGSSLNEILLERAAQRASLRSDIDDEQHRMAFVSLRGLWDDLV
jgi:predicted DNA-binding mobile mystery protein A